MKKFLLILLLSFSFAGTINIETGVEQFKIVNGDAGLELKIKASLRLSEVAKELDFMGAYIGLGVSQQYTAKRSNQFGYNHYGDRFDWSLGGFLGKVECIYTHSIRNKYSGASPDVIFFNQDVDSIKLRFNKQFKF